MRYELWYWPTNIVVEAYATEQEALAGVRKHLCGGDDTGYINRLGLVDKGAPGVVLTYPLEGAALLAKAFGLEEDGRVDVFATSSTMFVPDLFTPQKPYRQCQLDDACSFTDGHGGQCANVHV